MATLKDRILPVAYRARAIAGQLGFRPHRVYVVTRAETGLHTGDGPDAAVETEITEADGQPPKVRSLKEDEKALMGVSEATIEVGPITPQFSGGGTDPDLLTGSDLSTGDVQLLKVVGPVDTVYYRVIRRDFDKALGWRLTAIATSFSA